jgi:transcriptional regulator with XRE-family HTH domain
MKTKNETNQTFGEFFRLKRTSLGFTLRAFCEKYNYDPGNISRLERNILPPTLNDKKLAEYATVLKIKKRTKEWLEFCDLAHIAKGQIPQDIMSRPNSDKYLPLLFRTARGKKMTKKELEKLIELLNK